MSLGALILAGGQSRRMGQDKALLTRQGVSLLRHTWDVACALTPNVWIVTPWGDRYRPHLPPTAQWLPEAPPTPEAPSPGPLAAFAGALPTVTADWVLLLACDLPNVQATILRQWQAALPQVPATAIAYLPQTPQGWEPLCGFYRSTCGPSLQAYLATGQRSFQGWLNQQAVIPIPQVPGALLANCNTPADWAQLGGAAAPIFAND